MELGQPLATQGEAPDRARVRPLRAAGQSGGPDKRAGRRWIRRPGQRVVIFAGVSPINPSEPVELSVVAPARDEASNLPLLVEEVGKALAPTGLAFELLVVDDGSSDATPAVLAGCREGRPWLRGVGLAGSSPARAAGQSAAFHAGFRAARGAWIACLDADLQNDPADLPALLDRLQDSGADLVQGDRSHGRQDALLRRAGSAVGRLYRRAVLGDRVRDTGCSLRVMRRELALALPLEFAGMHRFVPALARQLGYRVVEMPVRHRARRAGRTKYGLGLARALPGLVDGLAVRWMARRRRDVAWNEPGAADRSAARPGPRPDAAPGAGPGA